MLTETPLILVVDDQPGVRLLVQEIFREVGYRVITAAHGQEALALLADLRPTLALVDVRMPVMDGRATLCAMQMARPEMPVIMMSAVEDGDAVNAALAEGARLIVSKPFDVFHLRAVVQQVLAGM